MLLSWFKVRPSAVLLLNLSQLIHHRKHGISQGGRGSFHLFRFISAGYSMLGNLDLAVFCVFYSDSDFHSG